MKRFTRVRAIGLRAAPLLALGALAGLSSGANGQDTTPAPATGLAPYFQPVTQGATTPDSDGFLRRWLLLEPIDKPNRSNTGFTATYVRQALTTQYFPGQFTAIPRDGQVVKAAQPLRWHALDSRAFDVKLFSFAKGLGKPTYGVIFWAVTIVDSPREMRDVRLAVGSNSASIWWLNGKETAGLFNDRRMVMDDVLSDRVTLRKGRNVLRGAVINGPGLSDFCVRFVDETGRPITDLKTDVR
ncbi:acetylxylan esterase [Sphingomonas faeni]|uniref:acetylxylan esterase n=1 Tax=Sphingomonas faeni TaxID=185950 RepID=UPI002FE2F0A1